MMYILKLNKSFVQFTNPSLIKIFSDYQEGSKYPNIGQAMAAAATVNKILGANLVQVIPYYAS